MKFWFLVQCPTCSARISFDDVERFVNNLISHGTLVTMVKQYLREDKYQRLCSSCQVNYIDDSLGNLCKKCQTDNDIIKKKIIRTVADCKDLLANEIEKPLESINDQANQLQQSIDQRVMILNEQIDKYVEEVENLLTAQQKANDANA